MGEPYVGEIRMFGGNFAPAGWAFCDGSTIPIVENDVLFQLIGTTYGGDGQSTFNLPDLQGRVPIHQGQGLGLSQAYQMGEKAGVETVTLNTNQIPSHNHTLVASTDNATSTTPTNNVLAGGIATHMFIDDVPDVNLAAQSIGPAGGSQSHENTMPFLVISFIISLFGVFPSQV
jgi:microcystin-dependent protein